MFVYMMSLSPYLASVVFNVGTAAVLITLLGLIPEPQRQRSNAVVVAMASGLYLFGALGVWEIPLALATLAFAYKGLTAYWGIGAAWLMHTVNDIIHHAVGAPMVPELPLSSFGCAILDPLLAIWFFAGAPSLLRRQPVGAGLSS